MTNAARSISSPLGDLRLLAHDQALVALLMPPHQPLDAGLATPATHPVLDLATAELEAFFAGHLRTFTVPVDAAGTEFQRAVWKGLTAIPFGVTWSYGDLAAHIGRPKAVRAVGAANGQNPISIIVPCHRVIGSDGRLTGYGGGLAAKEWLLRHEGAWAPALQRTLAL